MDNLLYYFGAGVLGIIIGYNVKQGKYSNHKLNLIIKTLNKMGEQLNEVKQLLAAADVKADKVAADVLKLHGLIQGTGETPTAAEWQEVKDAATNLNNKLQGIDDKTEEDAQA